MKKAKHGMTTDEFKDWLKWWKSALKQSEDYAKKMVTDLIKKHKLIIKEYPYSNEGLDTRLSELFEGYISVQLTKKYSITQPVLVSY